MVGSQVLPSIDTGGGRSEFQTPVNCYFQLEKHPVGDVEPVKFVVQYI